jgi:hypothetical protein
VVVVVVLVVVVVVVVVVVIVVPLLLLLLLPLMLLLLLPLVRNISRNMQWTVIRSSDNVRSVPIYQFTWGGGLVAVIVISSSECEDSIEITSRKLYFMTGGILIVSVDGLFISGVE